MSHPQTTGNVQPPGPHPRCSRVLIVDDHRVFREGLVALLEQYDFVKVCGEAGNSSEALDALRHHHPDLVLLDINLPGADGIELTRVIKTESPKTAVLIVSMHDEVFYGLKALRAGAYGYLVKDDIFPRLQEALAHGIRNEYYLTPKLQAHLVHHLIRSDSAAGKDRSNLQGLSDRELEVFYWLGKGLGTSQIAHRLGLGVKTIETHRAHIKTKLCVGSSEEMVRLAREWKTLEEKRNGETDHSALLLSPENTVPSVVLR